jgi:hypothetical protein
MVGRPPKPHGTPLNRGKLVDQLLSDLAKHKASTEKEAIERRSGRRITEEDRPKTEDSPTPPEEAS